jgi:hypothetical protein
LISSRIFLRWLLRSSGIFAKCAETYAITGAKISHGRRHTSCMVEVSEVSKASFSCWLVNESLFCDWGIPVMRRIRSSMNLSYTISKKNPIRRTLLTKIWLTNVLKMIY